jgi:hypothetical protein
MELQDVQKLSNFFEHKVMAYQVGVGGSLGFEEDLGRAPRSRRPAPASCSATFSAGVTRVTYEP